MQYVNISKILHIILSEFTDKYISTATHLISITAIVTNTKLFNAND